MWLMALGPVSHWAVTLPIPTQTCSWGPTACLQGSQGLCQFATGTQEILSHFLLPPASSKPHLCGVTCYPESSISILHQQHTRGLPDLSAASSYPGDLGGSAGQPMESWVRSLLGQCCSQPCSQGGPSMSPSREGFTPSHKPPEAFCQLLEPQGLGSIHGQPWAEIHVSLNPVARGPLSLTIVLVWGHPAVFVSAPASQSPACARGCRARSGLHFLFAAGPGHTPAEASGWGLLGDDRVPCKYWFGLVF